MYLNSRISAHFSVSERARNRSCVLNNVSTSSQGARTIPADGIRGIWSPYRRAATGIHYRPSHLPPPNTLSRLLSPRLHRTPLPPFIHSTSQTPPLSPPQLTPPADARPHHLVTALPFAVEASRPTVVQRYQLVSYLPTHLASSNRSTHRTTF